MAVGDTVRDRLDSGGVVKKLLEDKAPSDQIIEILFVRTLCRLPTSSEKSAMRELVGTATGDQAVYEDILWSLLNSSEFAFNH
jgi:hypothetical protein